MSYGEFYQHIYLQKHIKSVFVHAHMHTHTYIQGRNLYLILLVNIILLLQVKTHSCIVKLMCLVTNAMCVLSHFSCIWLFSTPWSVAHQAPLCMGFSRQECWSAQPFLPPGDLPDSGTEPKCPASPALQANSLPLSHQGSPSNITGNTPLSFV